MGFKEEYAQILNIISSDILRVNTEINSAVNLSSLIDKEINTFLNKNPKRIRPLISILYLRSKGIALNSEQYTFQTAIEIIHNASLIHDDVIDDSDVRRGEKTLNKKFNNKTAILSGDYLLSVAMLKLNSLNKPDIISLCTKTLAGMCKGEIEQYFSKYTIPKLEQYLHKTELKTANLFKTSLLGSMIIAGEKDLLLPERFAQAFGMAFQIRDDLINVTRQDSLKPTQNDIKNGIYNAPVILSGNTQNLQEGIAKTKILLNNYINEAKEALNDIESNQYKLAILKLLEILNNE